MGASLAMGLAHMGTAGLTAYNDGVDKNRLQEKEDAELAWKNEERAAIRAERAQKLQLNTSLANAARPAQVDAGYQVTDDAGSNAFTKDADAAAVLADMGNTNRPTGLASATRVQDTAYRDPKLALAAQQKYDSRPERLTRMSDAAMTIDPEKGASLADKATTARKDQKELDKEELAAIDEIFNKQLLTIASSGPDWSVRAAEVLTKSNAPGLEGMQVESVPSPDGRMVSFKVTTPNGESKIVSTYENTERGAEKWIRDASRLKSETKIGWLNENMKFERELEKIAARERDVKAPSGYQWNPDRTAQTYIPGGPADPANRSGGNNTMERVLLSGQRDSAAATVREQRKLIADLEEKTQTTQMRMAQRDGDKHPSYGQLQEVRKQIEEAKQALQTSSARVSEFDKALDEMTRQAMGSRTAPGLGSAKAPNAAANTNSSRPGNGTMSLRSTSSETDVPAILGAELRKAMAGAATDPRAAVNVDAIKKEIARLPKNQQQAALMAAGVQPSAGLVLSSSQSGNQPVTVTTAAEHAALPKGTRYTAPDGSVRIKQ